MSNYLISVTENYRVDTEQETIAMIQEAKDSNQYTLAKYSSQYKERKQKGEVVDAYWKVSLTKVFDDEKEPCGNATIIYQEGAF
ncbi:MAG: hypothetical protein J6B87_06340 [Clostridia bacterium]|nr:hypothetical protein [Clostridia bacterium]